MKIVVRCQAVATRSAGPAGAHDDLHDPDIGVRGIRGIRGDRGGAGWHWAR